MTTANTQMTDITTAVDDFAKQKIVTDYFNVNADPINVDTPTF